MIRESTPAYRPDATPTRGMGAIPGCLRDYDAAVRSAHPHYSFAALGPDAERVTRDHALADGLGERSPLAAVSDLGGSVLLLGCPLGHNTSLHLAEHRADLDHEFEQQGAPVLRGGEREWVAFETLAYEDADFADCAAAFAAAHPEHVTTGTVGAAAATLYDQPALVAFATEWLGENRG
jgi:aminoglycoside 3-N-acetyltransferase